MSSNFGNFMKNGWHPEKEGTTLKGQVNGLLGRNKEKDRADHVARPLSSLQDPSTFAPPPKRAPGQPLPPPPRSNATSPGVPPPPYDASNGYGQQEPEEEAPPPQPFLVNTTGLSTAHLPPPPGRKDGADGRSPAPGQAGVRPPPKLPPRLPPRNPSSTSTATSPSSPAPPPASSSGGYLNQSAMNRLGAAGVSVPSLGIGRSTPEPPARSNAGSPAPPPRSGNFSPPSGGQMSELQNRFSKFGKSSGQTSSPPPPTEGTTMEQKQAALRTASNFHKDPASVSMKDARSAASTFNNFRQRHGEQVAAGVKSANNLNRKYGIADKVGKYSGQGSGQAGEQQHTANAPSNPLSPPPGPVNALGKKKPPPPPPPKKKLQLGGVPQPPPAGAVDDDEPPPIPLATKPTF